MSTLLFEGVSIVFLSLPWFGQSARSRTTPSPVREKMGYQPPPSFSTPLMMDQIVRTTNGTLHLMFDRIARAAAGTNNDGQR